MESTAFRIVVGILFIGVLSVKECYGEPLARMKRDHKPGHEFSATQESKLMVVADVISYFLNQRGCSSQVVEQFLSQQCHGSPTSDDQSATFRAVMNYMEMLPEDRIYIIERKVQYGSVVVSILSKGVSGSNGQASYRYTDFINHLQSSRQEYLYQQSSAMVIRYVVKYMYEVESTSYIKTSFHSLTESTYGSDDDSDESGNESKSKNKGKKKSKKSKKNSSNSSD